MKRSHSLAQNKYSMTACTKTGIKIKNSGNDYVEDPFANIDPFQYSKKDTEAVNLTYSSSQYQALNLNIDEYSREDLYKLFGLHINTILTEENMKQSKKIVLKTHPDKSHLENKYFIFFKQAYAKLYEIYQFQNKTTHLKKQADQYETEDSHENQLILDKMFEMKKDLKDSTHFNDWFNAQFEKHRIEDPVEHGYGNWLKSDEDIIYAPQNTNKDKMNLEINKRKKELQQLIPYQGVNLSIGSSSAGGSSLMEYNSNFSSNSLFSGSSGYGYTDLKQAYVESVIPVTEDDYYKRQAFHSVEEYKRHRDTTDITPLSKEEAMHQLMTQNKTADEESAALAFYYAKQSEKIKNSNNEFWYGLKQLTNK
jgi:hypothetical protein